MAKPIVFSADIEKDIAEKFDKIAEKNLRSRAGQLEFIIKREVENSNSDTEK